MYRKISLALASKDETENEIKKDFGFLACATTGFRYKQLFGTELLGDVMSIMSVLSPAQQAAINSAAVKGDAIDLNVMDKNDLAAFIAIAETGKLNCISKMAFIMNKQAEGADMRRLETDNYFDWLEQFESMEFLVHSLDFISLYMANVQGTSTPKKGPAPSTAK